MEARRNMNTVLEKVEQMTGVLGDHTMTLRVMNDTLHFQASFVGDQGDSFERFTKEVNEHMKEATGSSKAQREAIDMVNERVTQRRREVDELDTLVWCLCWWTFKLTNHSPLGQGDGWIH